MNWTELRYNNALLWLILNQYEVRTALMNTFMDVKVTDEFEVVMKDIEAQVKGDERLLLDRKKTDQSHIDIGLFYLPNNEVTPFVTWIINTSLIEKTGEEYTALGHYYNEYEDAYKDFRERS